MTRFLLDTNILSDVFRNPEGRVASMPRQRREDEIGTSLIVSAEMRFGLIRNRNSRRLERLEVILRTMTVWPLESPLDAIYGAERTRLESQGIVLGPNDMWIAAHSMMLDAVLVSDDRVFLRVPGLMVENWLRDEPAP